MRKYLVCRTVAWLVFFCLGTLNLTAAEHHGQVKFGGLPVPGATVTAAKGETKLVTVTDEHSQCVVRTTGNQDDH